MSRLPLAVLLLVVLSACAKKEAMAPQDGAGLQGVARPDSLLAYEHAVSIELAAEALRTRMAMVREACLQAQHGACSLLEFKESSGRHPSGRLRMRLAPAAVEPIVEMSSSAGRLASRSTIAEDLSAAVAETGRQRAQLAQQLERLNALSARTDLSVADQLVLARELSTLEVQLQERERESAQQSLRLETNLLSIEFSVPYQQQSRWSSIGEAWDEVLDGFIDGFAEAIQMLAYLLPYLVFAFPLALIWWLLWRTITGRLRRGGDSAR